MGVRRRKQEGDGGGGDEDEEEEEGSWKCENPPSLSDIFFAHSQVLGLAFQLTT